MILSPDAHGLFYGDSITDSGRNRDDRKSLGGGYVNQIAARLASNYPDWNLRITNKGISGNCIHDLESRLDEDVLSLDPGIVSILIGINDTWRRYDSNLQSPISKFQEAYRRIIERLMVEKKRRIVICEPFLLPTPAERRTWREDLDPRITAIRELAWKYKLPYLPLDGIFAAAATATGHEYWLPDGVHPSPAGHALIAERWLELATKEE